VRRVRRVAGVAVVGVRRPGIEDYKNRGTEACSAQQSQELPARRLVLAELTNIIDTFHLAP
jgi:hypothetical protein